MYIKIGIANKELAEKSQEHLFWLILIFGAFISGELVSAYLTRKVEVQAGATVAAAAQGVSTAPVTNVQQATVDTQNVSTQVVQQTDAAGG